MQGASILVVDDEREIVRALRRALSAKGYTVLSASSGEEALEFSQSGILTCSCSICCCQA
jgi:CheY-like chemotaxis protein